MKAESTGQANKLTGHRGKAPRDGLVISFAVSLMLALCLTGDTQAAGRHSGADTGSPAFDGNRFVYKAEGKRLSDVLQDFAASQGLPAVIDVKIDGSVSGSFDTPPRTFLDALTRSYGLIWYNDRTALYFYPAKSIQSKVFRLKGYSQRQVNELLESLQLGDKRFPVKYNSKYSTLLVYGPPRHVELVSMAIESLDANATDGNRLQTRVFPLAFASACDRQLGTVTIPGVASVLRSLYSGGGTPSTSSSSALRGSKLRIGIHPSGPSTMEGMSSEAMRLSSMMTPTTYGNPLAPLQAPANSTAAGDSGTRGGMTSLDQGEIPPSFQADEGINAVVVLAQGNKMRELQELIRRLDVKPVLVELEAMIIDVSADSLEELGVDWSLASRSGTRLSVDSPAGRTPNDTGTPSGIEPGSYTVSTVLANAGRSLVARVRALQGQGKARIVSKPKVLGVANRPSTMTEKREVNVRVAGNLEANLFAIEAGTLLQVTPQITSARNGVTPQIKMSLYIEDGSFEPNTVDQVPVVKRTEIRTEAHVREGESLLIGGITIESDATVKSGIPVLSALPVLGGLFSWKSSRTSRIERLFLITPRVIGDEIKPAVMTVPVNPDELAALQPAPPAPDAQASAPKTAADGGASNGKTVDAIVVPSYEPPSEPASAASAGTSTPAKPKHRRHKRQHSKGRHASAVPAKSLALDMSLDVAQHESTTARSKP